MWCIGENIVSKSNNQKNILLKNSFLWKKISGQRTMVLWNKVNILAHWFMISLKLINSYGRWPQLCNQRCHLWMHNMNQYGYSTMINIHTFFTTIITLSSNLVNFHQAKFMKGKCLRVKNFSICLCAKGRFGCDTRRDNFNFNGHLVWKFGSSTQTSSLLSMGKFTINGQLHSWFIIIVILDISS
jgi:hypothetical protein